MAMANDFTGDLAQLKQLLRNYRLDKLLRVISAEGYKLMSTPQTGLTPGVKEESYRAIIASTRASVTRKVFLTAWGLVDLAYYSILFSNDYRANRTPDHDELLFLFQSMDAVIEAHEKEHIGALGWTHEDTLYHIYGMCMEQFQYETFRLHSDAQNRELYMLLDLAHTLDQAINIPQIIEKEIGVNWQNVLASLFLAWYMTTANLTERQVVETCLWNQEFPAEDFQKVLAYYTLTYQDVQTDQTLKRQIFYTKPFILTEREKERFAISPYLVCFVYEHCLFWLVRNYYNKQNDQTFTAYFGKLFETYFEELLQETIGANHFTKIDESLRDKRADWKIHIDEYLFLVEQKSAAISLTVKQQIPDIGKEKTFIDRHLIKALQQLAETESFLNDGKYIKIILIYEPFLNTHILDAVFKESNCNLTDDGYYWVMTIEEAEILFSAYKENHELFQAIVEEKIKRETSKSPEGRSILQLSYNYGIKKNPYVEKESIKKYDLFSLPRVTSILPDPDTTVHESK